MSVTVENFKPLQDYVMVLIPVIEPKTKLGIMKSKQMLEDEFKATPQVFKVVGVGEKVTNIDEGQYVLCTRVNEVPVDSLDEDFKVAVVRMFDVVGVTDEI